jgi:hypothetical protein
LSAVGLLRHQIYCKNLHLLQVRLEWHCWLLAQVMHWQVQLELLLLLQLQVLQVLRCHLLRLQEQHHQVLQHCLLRQIQIYHLLMLLAQYDCQTQLDL